MVEDGSHTEYICDGLAFSCEVFDIDDLRSHIAGSTTPDEQIGFLVCNCSQTEIYYHHILAILPKHYVLRFQISMYYVLSGHLSQTLKQILHNLPRLILSEFVSGLELGK